MINSDIDDLPGERLIDATQRLIGAVERMAAVERLMADLEVRFGRVEGDVIYMRGVLKGLVDRVTALEVLRTGSEEGSFSWALVMLRQGVSMRRRAWGDASRVEQFDWHRWLDGCPDEDLLACDWQRAF